MKTRIFAWILAAILLLAALPAIAEGEPENDVLSIDEAHVYPNMDKSFENGYAPKSTQKDMRILLPLVGEVEGGVIHVTLELPKDDTFASGDPSFDVAEQTFTCKNPAGQTESVKAYLIDCTIPVSDSRVNGTHIVRAVVSYRSKAGEIVEQMFHVQTNVTNGKSAQGDPWSSPSEKNKPLLLVRSCRITPEELFGGEQTSVRLSIVNAGDLAAKNIRISLTSESDALLLRGDRNAQFFDALPVNAALETSFDLDAVIGAAEGPAAVTVQLAYEDKYGSAFTDEYEYTIGIAQPKIAITNCEYSEAVNGGDSFTVTLTVGNVGTRDTKNITVQFAAGDDSLRNKGTQDRQGIESLKAGESATVSFDLRALPSASEGRHSFRFDCTYQDAENGGTYTNGMEYTLSVVQKATIGHDDIKLPEMITSGESFTLPVCVYNTGYSPIYNVRCTIRCDGLICSSAFLGNLAPQESADKTITVFVTTLSGTQKYGETYGTAEITYEDENGEQQTEYQDLKMTIAEPVKITDEEKARQEQERKDQQTLSQWWISLLVAIAIIIVLVAIILITRFARLMRIK
jgi:hypothetical protein